MKYILIIFLFFGMSLYGKSGVAAKKARFYGLVLPPIQKVYSELKVQYDEVARDINSSSNTQKIQKLKESYGVKSDKELLVVLKPHPKSIVLAQAAMESAWATSRFFIQANNIFGIWATEKDKCKIAANKKRGGTRTMWLRKFKTLEDSVRFYYRTIAKNKAYKEFREVRYNSDNVIEMVEKLDKYSEMGKKYTSELRGLIRYNNLTKYDD